MGGCGALKWRIVRVRVRVVVAMRRRRVGRCGAGASGGMAKGKLEEVPDLRFGVRLGLSYGHAFFFFFFFFFFFSFFCENEKW